MSLFAPLAVKVPSTRGFTEPGATVTLNGL
jgi:hypothetical protein